MSPDLGHKINHASGEKIANVVPLAMHIDRRYLPHYLLRYAPCVPISDLHPTQIVLVGFFSSKFISSGSELLMNYFEAFDLHSTGGKAGAIDWLDTPTKIDEEYLLKKEYVFDVPPSLKRFVDSRLPLNMRKEFVAEHYKMLENNDRLMQAIVDSSASKKNIGGSTGQPSESSKDGKSS